MPVLCDSDQSFLERAGDMLPVAPHYAALVDASSAASAACPVLFAEPLAMAAGVVHQEVFDWYVEDDGVTQTGHLREFVRDAEVVCDDKQ